MNDVHLKHSLDGWPLCWPQAKNEEFEGTYKLEAVTCPACKKIADEIEKEIAE